MYFFFLSVSRWNDMWKWSVLLTACFCLFSFRFYKSVLWIQVLKSKAAPRMLGRWNCGRKPLKRSVLLAASHRGLFKGLSFTLHRSPWRVVASLPCCRLLPAVGPSSQTHLLNVSPSPHKGSKVLQNDEFTKDLFRFLQLMCEGHNGGETLHTERKTALNIPRTTTMFVLFCYFMI